MSSARKTGWLALPLTAWLGWFLVLPIGFIAVYSLQVKGPYGGVVYVWNMDQYRRALDPLYGAVLWNSLRLAIMTSFSCLIFAYPMAWTMARARPAYRHFLMVAVMLPFMSNFVIRAYAVKFLIGVEGPMNRFAMAFGLWQLPLFQERPDLAVWYGMVTNYLPFMILPLYVTMEQFDMRLIEAAKDLGANAWQVGQRILWPLTRRSVGTGLILVFVPALGEFIIPDLMGGARTMYFGSLVTEQFLKTRDWPFGSAFGMIMLGCVGLVLLLQNLLHRSDAVVRTKLKREGGRVANIFG